MNRVIEGWNIRIWVGPAEGWMVAIRLFLPTDPAEPIMGDRLPFIPRGRYWILICNMVYKHHVVIFVSSE